MKITNFRRMRWEAFAAIVVASALGAAQIGSAQQSQQGGPPPLGQGMRGRGGMRGPGRMMPVNLATAPISALVDGLGLSKMQEAEFEALRRPMGGMRMGGPGGPGMGGPGGPGMGGPGGPGMGGPGGPGMGGPGGPGMGGPGGPGMGGPGGPRNLNQQQMGGPGGPPPMGGMGQGGPMMMDASRFEAILTSTQKSRVKSLMTRLETMQKVHLPLELYGILNLSDDQYSQLAALTPEGDSAGGGNPQAMMSKVKAVLSSDQQAAMKEFMEAVRPQGGAGAPPPPDNN